jgi:hypothetical protein
LWERSCLVLSPLDWARLLLHSPDAISALERTSWIDLQISRLWISAASLQLHTSWPGLPSTEAYCSEGALWLQLTQWFPGISIAQDESPIRLECFWERERIRWGIDLTYICDSAPQALGFITSVLRTG